jgi:DNA-binding SARP family transcriptional activator
LAKRSSLAKLSRPKLFGVVGRDRLFARLDHERNDRAVIWIAAPPGAGKTALAASYLETRNLPTIWYQVDSGDSDPATFFYYMGLAGRSAAGRKRLLLPLLTPEYLSDLPGFARRFFRKLFASLPESQVLVLDNYQEVTPESVLHTVIQQVIAELPQDMNLLVLSHTDPPSQFSRVLANNLIGQIDWEDLRLTLAETKAIAASANVQTLGEETLLLLQDQTKGWAAGLVLMMERFKRTGVINHISRSETMEWVFNYFAGQVFEQASSEMREFLMRTAVLPHMTSAMAIAISHSAQGRDLLDYLYRHRLFIDRRGGEEANYYYHTLFREFLLTRGRKYFAEPELLEIKREAAGLLEKNGEAEAAAALYGEAGEWKEVSRLICWRAPALLAQGRNQLLQQLIDLLPQYLTKATPWILYWRGMSRLLFDPILARSDLEQAYVGFQDEGESAGLFLSCGAIMDAYFYAEDDMRPVLLWAKHLQQLLEHYGGFPSIEIELRVLASIQALMFVAPHHPLLELLEERIEASLSSTAEPSVRVAIACATIWLPLWRGNSCKCRQVIDEITPLLNSPSVPPLLRILWRNIEGCYAWSTTASHHISAQKFREAREIAQEAGISTLNCMLWGGDVYGALAVGDVVAGQAGLEQFQRNLGVQRKHELGQFRFLRAGAELLQGNLHAALDDASAALQLQEEVERPFMIAAGRYGLAQILVETGDMEGARSHLIRAVEYARMMKNPMLEHQCLLVEAYSWIKQGDEQRALAPLTEALRIGRANDFLFLNCWWRPEMMASLFSLALQSGVEVSYVQSVIRRRNIQAESQDIEVWPWPIKIYTLGRFEILCDNAPLHSSGKAQHKPLELLKCLCAYGGQTVNQDRLSDVLWPDASGDAAEQALRTTLHRLRKLLHCEEAVRLEDRHLSLNPRYVWTDCIAFDRVAHHPDMTNRASLQRALNRYRGHFLEGETSSWALTYRNRLRAHYMSMAERLGAMLEQESDWLGAIECYIRAIEVEPVAEIFYRRLMSVYARLGRCAEAMAAYQRCRHSLLTRLGVSPSPETQALYQTLHPLSGLGL